GVTLEKRRRDLDVDLAFDGALNDARFVLAGGDDRALARVANCRAAHRHRLARHELLAEEVGGGVLARDRIERDEPRAAIGAGAGLVESDVPRLADAENLKVDAARAHDLLLELASGRPDILTRHLARRDVDVRRIDVDLREEILPHEAVVGVDALLRHRVVLVEVERHDVLEAQSLVAMHANQLAIDPDRRRSSGQTEDYGLSLCPLPSHEGRDALRDEPCDLLVIVDDDRANELSLRGAVNDMRKGGAIRRIAHPPRFLDDPAPACPSA